MNMDTAASGGGQAAPAPPPGLEAFIGKMVGDLGAAISANAR